MKVLIILILCINLLFPRFYTFNYAYQSSLWSNASRGDSRDGKGKDITFQIGSNIKGFREWKRLQLGFPDNPVTIDVQFQSRIVQVRIEVLNLLINLIPTFLVIFVAIIRKKTKSHGSQV